MSLFMALFGLCLLGVAAWRDIALRRIPDTVSVGLVVVGLAIRGGEGVAALGSSLLCSAILFSLLVVVHARGLLGGGDVKLAAALAIGLPPLETYHLVVLTGLLGGVLGLFYLLLARLLPVVAPAGTTASFFRRVWAVEAWRIRRRGSLPYGVAIAGAGAFLLLRPLGG